MEQENYRKIERFVQETYAQISNQGISINRISQDKFQVGNWHVECVDGKWHVSDAAGDCQAVLLQPRLALLIAALLKRGKKTQAIHISNLDVSYNIATNDMNFYLRKIIKDPGNALYQDRLDNARRSLDLLRVQISEMEKTVNLQ